MKILKENKLVIKCPSCWSMFIIDPEDITVASGFRFVNCPVCKKSINLNDITNKENEVN